VPLGLGDAGERRHPTGPARLALAGGVRALTNGARRSGGRGPIGGALCFTVAGRGRPAGGSVMRKLIGAVAMAAFVGLGAVAPPAGAAAGGRVRTVEFTGTSTFEFRGRRVLVRPPDPRRNARHPPGRPPSTSMAASSSPSGTTFPYTGTFTIDIEGRRSIAGTVSGEVGGTPPSSTCPDGWARRASPSSSRPCVTTGERRPHPTRRDLVLTGHGQRARPHLRHPDRELPPTMH
jgi:hypothetical protein